jgi:hypothetical protein
MVLDYLNDTQGMTMVSQKDAIILYAQAKKLPYFKNRSEPDYVWTPSSKPAIIAFNWGTPCYDGVTGIQLYLDENHRPTEQACRISYTDPQTGCHYRDPKLGPGFVMWYPNSQMAEVDYFHKDTKEELSTYRWYDNGQLRASCHWDIDGKLHRDPLDGPAHGLYQADGTVIKKAYYLHGLEVDKSARLFDR